MAEHAERSWTVQDLLTWTEDYFRRLGLPTPRLDAELLLASALRAKRLDLYLGYHKLVEPDERARFRELVARRARREPVAYLTGEREFYSLAFCVNRDVLIPRPETEHVVEEALRVLHGVLCDAEPLRILDLGTGSGNLAVTLAVKLPAAHVDAVDLSRAALEVARTNAERHGVADRVALIAGDLFSPLGEPRPRYDAVVSNPPYVSREDYAALMDDVRLYEPQAALLDTKSAGGDGCGYYRHIAQCAPAFLKPGGHLVLEVGRGQAIEVRSLLEGSGLIHSRTVLDYGGVERVVSARKPAPP